MFPKLYSIAPANDVLLPLNTGIGGYNYVVICSLLLTGLNTGDLILFNSQFQSVSTHHYNVMVAWYLVRTDSATTTTGEGVIPAIGKNIVKGHGQRNLMAVLAGSDQITTPGDYYYNLVGYSASTRTQPGHVTTIPASTCKLWGLVFSPPFLNT